MSYLDPDELIKECLKKTKKMRKKKPTKIHTLIGKILGYLILGTILLFFIWLIKKLLIAIF